MQLPCPRIPTELPPRFVGDPLLHACVGLNTSCNPFGVLERSIFINFVKSHLGKPYDSAFKMQAGSRLAHILGVQRCVICTTAWIKLNSSSGFGGKRILLPRQPGTDLLSETFKSNYGRLLLCRVEDKLHTISSTI